MSYILFASGSSIATPVSIANGGTSAIDSFGAMVNLTSPAFANSSQFPQWGDPAFAIVPPSAAPDPNENQRAINELLALLQDYGMVFA